MKALLKKLRAFFFRKVKGRIDYVGGKEVLKAPLSKEEEEYYLKEVSLGSLEARNVLIEHNLRLVIYVAKRFETNITNLEDLVSIGTLGLIKAIKTFKSDKNIKLATYASRCIENEILMALRKKTRQKREISLDEPLSSDGDGNELVLGDIIQTDAIPIPQELDNRARKEELREALKGLKPREIEILTLRFGLDMKKEYTQKETAIKMGISQSYISRLEKKILKKLKGCLTK